MESGAGIALWFVRWIGLLIYEIMIFNSPPDGLMYSIYCSDIFF